MTRLPIPTDVMKTCGLVVSFNPPPTFPQTIAAISQQVDLLIVVDNASSPQQLDGALVIGSAELRLIHNEINIGVGAALNQGFKLAVELGYTHIVALDQDCHPSEGFVASLLNAFRAAANSDRLAMVSPKIKPAGIETEARYLQRRWGPIFELAKCRPGGLQGVTITMTSGTLFSLEVFRKVGPFREDFFIDYVDTEYCLRVRRAGYHIAVDCGAELVHRWGNRREHRFGLLRIRPTHHPPERWYYLFRNRIPLLFEYGLDFLHWMTFDLITMTWWFIRMLVFEEQRLPKLKGVLQGTVDGLRGNLGPGNRI